MASFKRMVMAALALVGIFLVTATYASATTYYVDFSSGADSNSGLSKSAPWKHAPGMNGASGNASTVTLGPGDSIVLKGGVTWDYTVLPWQYWNGQGNATTDPLGCAGSGC